jgi:hypothetical protein
MINNDILAIKDSILATVGDSCGKIHLFGFIAQTPMAIKRAL